MAKASEWIIRRIKLMRDANGDGTAAGCCYAHKVSPKGRVLYAYHQRDDRHWIDEGYGWFSIEAIPEWVTQTKWWHEIELSELELFPDDEFTEKEIELALELIQS